MEHECKRLRLFNSVTFKDFSKNEIETGKRSFVCFVSCDEGVGVYMFFFSQKRDICIIKT